MLLLAGDYDPTLRAATPAALRAGARGDASLLAKLQATAQADELVPGVRSLSVAAYYAASCQDPPYPGRRPIPWPPDSSMPGRWPTGSRPACPLTPRWC